MRARKDGWRCYQDCRQCIGLVRAVVIIIWSCDLPTSDGVEIELPASFFLSLSDFSPASSCYTSIASSILFCIYSNSIACTSGSRRPTAGGRTGGSDRPKVRAERTVGKAAASEGSKERERKTERSRRTDRKKERAIFFLCRARISCVCRC